MARWISMVVVFLFCLSCGSGEKEKTGPADTGAKSSGQNVEGPNAEAPREADVSVDEADVTATKKEAPAAPVKLPNMVVTARPGAVQITVNFSSYCSPEPKLVHRVDRREIFVNAKVSDGPLSRCVEPYERTIDLDGLEDGSYTVHWDGAGTLSPVVVKVPKSVKSEVLKKDGKMVDKIDPKKVGRNALLSTIKLGGQGDISNIMSANSDGLSNKLAVAMSGEGSEVVMGHGSGGMGFKGTGSGGGGTGYGRIHGLGKVDTGGGRGVKAGLGRKGRRRNAKMRIGSGKTAGFCSKGNIQSVVRRRAGAIRTCYEKRLLRKPGLKGKLNVRWKIGLDGRVNSASIAKSTMKDAKVEQCITRIIRRLRFQKPEGGTCVVQWPFVFNSGG